MVSHGGLSVIVELTALSQVESLTLFQVSVGFSIGNRPLGFQLSLAPCQGVARDGNMKGLDCCEIGTLTKVVQGAGNREGGFS